MKHTPFWSETGGLGALTPACGAQVGYPGYPVDIRIGNLSPEKPLILPKVAYSNDLLANL